MKPRLLDLFCGAGGAAMGYHRAGFEVVGVDIKPQPHYPFEFHQGDAMTWPLDGFDAVHASPPCQDWTRCTSPTHGTAWMLPTTRERLQAWDGPWVIENVPGAEMRPDYKLCGCQFSRPKLKRLRLFETSWNGFALLPPCWHPERIVSVTGDGPDSHSAYRRQGREWGRLKKEAMGIDWMNGRELSQAIPPDYTEFIGKELLAHLRARA